jgi:DHA2 family multidrug resistance protein-like MFS transporter
MLATSRLIGQTTGATIVAIAFRFAAHAELIALAVAALFAFAGALASLSRLRYGNPVERSERQPVPVAP